MIGGIYFGGNYFGDATEPQATASKSGGPSGAASLGASKAVTVDKSGGPKGGAVLGASRTVLRDESGAGTRATGALGAAKTVLVDKSTGLSGTGALGGDKQVVQESGPKGAAILGGSKDVAIARTTGVKAGGILGGVSSVFVPSTPGGVAATATLGGVKTVAVTLDKTGGPKARGRFGFEGPDHFWTPPSETDVYYARLPFHESQRVLGAAAFSGRRSASCEWHHTAYDSERGSFGVVRRDGPLVDLVGQRVRVVLTDGSNRSVVVYVHESGDMDEDFSLTRRAFLALDAPSKAKVEAVIQPKVLVS